MSEAPPGLPGGNPLPRSALRPPMPPKPAAVADSARDEGRDQPREFVRQRPREPHEKFDLPDGTAERGMDYLWAAVKIPYTTQRSPRLDDFRRSGWQFARAADFRELSGLDRNVSDRFVELGIDQVVKPDDPVIRDNLVLMMRPKNLSAEAAKEDKDRAQRQISEHLRQQKERSERAIGAGRTRMTRQYGPADEAPSDQDTEI